VDIRNGIGTELRRFQERWTLKKRIITIFVASSLLSFASIVVISNYAIDSIFENKIQHVVQSNLQQVKLSFEHTISNLNHISQQLSFQGSIGKKLDQLMSEERSYERAQLTAELKSELNTITFTNPGIGLTMYYLADEGGVLFENYPVKDGYDPDKLPLLDAYYGISYYGPHRSNDRFSNEFVLSALRKVVIPARDDVFIYIESGFNLTQNILDSDRISDNMFHLVVDKGGRVAYSEQPQLFPMNAQFPNKDSAANFGEMQDYFWFKGTSNQGWSIISVIPRADYYMERDRWMMQIVIFSLILLVVSLLLAILLWKMVYKPLTGFHKEIKWMGQSDFVSISKSTNIPEFDHLLQQFREMKAEIRRLFLEVEQKEKRRADLEIEKMLYQINPHFLMNTLDTAHWLAVMNGQTEIDRLIVALNKLLAYNLRNPGQRTTVQEELDALQEYLILQQIRYDFHFDVRIVADERVRGMSIPRFILQPLVENALYHGLSDDGFIQVEVADRPDDCIQIAITDNGAGMSEEIIARLLENDAEQEGRAGMGIGMSYVKRILAAYYGGQAGMDIRSEIGAGTTIRLTLPKWEADSHD